MAYLDEGEGSYSITKIWLSTEGAGADTGAVSGSYDGKRAKIIKDHSQSVKAGPIFVPYDSFSASVLSAEF